MIYKSKKAVTDLPYKITGCAITVHRELGLGLLESLYEKCLVLELEHQGYQIQRQQTVPALVLTLVDWYIQITNTYFIES